MELESYRRCIGQQLEELELLSSIYCGAGELQLLDAGVVADFNEFLATNSSPTALRSHLEYIIKLSLSGKRVVDVRIELPHLYPLVELARISVHTTLLGKVKQQLLKTDITKYLEEQCNAEEPYIYQLLSWLQDQIEALLLRPSSELESPPAEELPKAVSHLERLWIFSHHIKSSAKRQEIVRLARQLQLSGFSRPGKPGIICVEGQPDQVQEYWRTIKMLRWQKISLVRTEQRQRKRLFDNFSEQLFNANDGEEGVMNMGQFIRFLEAHGTGYMKSELFGLD
ncbi:RWD domain-containing protein 2B [Drosophila innubila]|uniref:RWD domain-containing protein 2B n=1 Tax=Drosophila innubila TaxID=198719 RepID=UPI00148C238F|nr:RWD domain-containing protein 2B [Drosophila innubila]